MTLGEIIAVIVALILVCVTVAAVEAARRGTEQATWARIDQRSPQITIIAYKALPPRSKWAIPLEPIRLVEGSAGERIALAGWFKMRNEGRATALVKLPADVRQFDTTDGLGHLIGLDNLIGLNYPNHLTGLDHLTGLLSTEPRPCTCTQFPLEPDSEVWLYVEVGLTTREWVTHIQSGPQTLKAQIRVDDLFEDGISDHIELHLRGMPIRTGDQPDVWIGKGDNSVLVVERIKRKYHRLNRRLGPSFSSARRSRRLWL